MDVLTRTDIASLLRFDFSAVDDIRYYNGIVFKGYIQGLPGSVLSGGQYDRLMEKMHRKSGAMGFAVYMDALEMLEAPAAYDVDAVLLYSETDSLTAVRAKAEALMAQGKTVLVQRQMPENIRCKEVLNM
jgi:ATP phosphoribosyltransferase regulatory subunit